MDETIEKSDALVAPPRLTAEWPSGGKLVLTFIRDADGNFTCDFAIERTNVSSGMLAAFAMWASATAQGEMWGMVWGSLGGRLVGEMRIVRDPRIVSDWLCHVAFWFEATAKLEMQAQMMSQQARILAPGGRVGGH